MSEVFLPARVESQDEHQMGWRALPLKAPLIIEFEHLAGATSEGVNTLALLCDLFDFENDGPGVEIKVDKDSQAIVDAMGLRALAKRQSLSLMPLRPYFADPYSHSTGPCVAELKDQHSAVEMLDT